MEETMTHQSFRYHPTPEHRLTRAKWIRGFGIVYGTMLLLLLAIATAQHIRGERNGAAAVANGHPAQPARTEQRPNVAIGAPAARQAANPIAHADWE
jgi:hypothetical protein